MKVSGVILAAGRSTRLGRPKQLLLLDGEPIIRITARNALASRLNEVVLVVGAESEAVAAAVGGLGQRTVVNPDFELGQSTSLRAGLASISKGSDAVMFLLGDQPEVTSAHINALIDAFEGASATIVQPTYGGTPGNPVLFARSLFDDLATVAGDEGARSLMKVHAAEILRVNISDGPPPGDVDTDADYAALVIRWTAQSQGSSLRDSGGRAQVPPLRQKTSATDLSS